MSRYYVEQVEEYEELLAYTTDLHKRMREEGSLDTVDSSDLDFQTWRAKQEAAKPKTLAHAALSNAFSYNLEAANGAHPENFGRHPVLKRVIAAEGGTKSGFGP